MRYQINMFVQAHPEFPVNTYEADTVPDVTSCITHALLNDQSGIARIEVIDSRFGGLQRNTKAPMRLGKPKSLKDSLT